MFFFFQFEERMNYENYFKYENYFYLVRLKVV